MYTLDDGSSPTHHTYVHSMYIAGYLYLLYYTGNRHPFRTEYTEYHIEFPSIGNWDRNALGLIKCVAQFGASGAKTRQSSMSVSIVVFVDLLWTPLSSTWAKLKISNTLEFSFT